MKDIHVEQRRRLTSLVYFDDILLVNIAIVVAFRSVFFFKDKPVGTGSTFFDEELP